jgi:hypothetical protein
MFIKIFNREIVALNIFMMLQPTNYTVPAELIQMALEQMPSDEFRFTLNKPTGNFFYDAWQIKPEFKDTVWEQLLSALPAGTGEARIITLQPGRCYQSHSDIDDRYHLNLSGTKSYIIDLDVNEMYHLNCDATWYDMDAAHIHSAVNFGRTLRVQLVVRKLLLRNKLKSPVPISIVASGLEPDHARYAFDNRMSEWLNHANKRKLITDFSYTPSEVKFVVEERALPIMHSFVPEGFKVIK